jgi:hypothetical protein
MKSFKRPNGKPTDGPFDRDARGYRSTAGGVLVRRFPKPAKGKAAVKRFKRERMRAARVA